MHFTRWLSRGLLVLIAMFWLWQSGPVSADAPTTSPASWQVAADPGNAISMAILNNYKKIIGFRPTGWGPKWGASVVPNVTAQGKDGHLHFRVPMAFDTGLTSIIHLTADLAPSGDDSLVCTYNLSAKTDVPLTAIALSFATGAQTGKLVLTTSDKQQKTIPLPNPQMDDVDAVIKMEFQLDQFGTIAATFDQPLVVGLEKGNPRAKLIGTALKAADRSPSMNFPAGKKTVTVTLTTPGPMQFLSSAADRAHLITPIATPEWFVFKPDADYSKPSVIGMEDWLDAPAGKHGGVRMVGDRFQFEDGTPVKFWGTNICYLPPEKKFADVIAAKFAKYGINGVRLHKFTSETGPQGFTTRDDATQFVPAGIDRLDFFCSTLKAHGVYYGFSHTYGFHVGPGNASKLLAYDEIGGGNTSGLINAAPDIQDLMIERIVNLLNHVNPYTKLTYAQDPGFSYIEIQNEDDIFWFETAGALASRPTYAKAFNKRFSDWLGNKYKTQDALAAAWGKSLNGQSIANGNIGVQANPYFMSEDPLAAARGGDRQRLLDTAAFMHQCQDDYYLKTVKAIRDTGYKGPICGSPWQAPGGLPAMYNIASDRATGFIDRHNYGGGSLNYDMLSEVGGGYIATGLQQVMDRPFGISEWITQFPSMYSADGPAALAAYGMGLQGWDASYEFTSNGDLPAYQPLLGPPPWGVWQVDIPTQMGQAPTLSRMIFRGDVKEGPIIADRRIGPNNLATGKFDFSDKVVQNGDVKSFGGSVAPAALAAGRCVIEFTDHDQPSTFPDMSKYMDGAAVVSETGQLCWDPTHRGYFTVNTDGTKAVVGFAADKPITLGNVSMTLHTPYASVFLTAAAKGQTLADSPTAIISAIARIVNTGESTSILDGGLKSYGAGPIMMEPVKADITIAGRPVTAVNVLDQDGRKTDQTLPVKGGAFAIDTGAQKTMYYEVVFGK